MQVATGLEKMISEEVLRIGDKLPSVRVLSEEYGIDRIKTEVGLLCSF
jgi:DNA-binding GntR family transcriptional regulator